MVLVASDDGFASCNFVGTDDPAPTIGHANERVHSVEWSIVDRHVDVSTLDNKWRKRNKATAVVDPVEVAREATAAVREAATESLGLVDDAVVAVEAVADRIMANPAAARWIRSQPTFPAMLP